MEGNRDELWREGAQASIVATYDGIRTQSETDFTSDLRKVDVPTLLIHGEDNQLVPLESAATMTAKLILRFSLNIYPSAPHGLIVTHADRVNADISAFAKRSS